MAGLVHLLRERMRMVREDALAVAHVVEEAFQGRSELDDELLDKDTRQVFYDLQNEKILEVRREETREEGVARRHYLWRIRDEPGRDLQPAADPDPMERLYRRLADDAWERRRLPE
jgi:transcription initiation factor IIE alpha subunit